MLTAAPLINSSSALTFRKTVIFHQKLSQLPCTGFLITDTILNDIIKNVEDTGNLDAIELCRFSQFRITGKEPSPCSSGMVPHRTVGDGCIVSAFTEEIHHFGEFSGIKAHDLKPFKPDEPIYNRFLPGMDNIIDYEIRRNDFAGKTEEGIKEIHLNQIEEDIGKNRLLHRVARIAL